MTRQKRIISHHMLRRRARARLEQLHAAQRVVADQTLLDDVAHRVLHDAGVRTSDMLRVEPAKRGPWRWYVTAV